MNKVTFALQNIKNTIMSSSEDFKRILELYDQESKTSGAVQSISYDVGTSHCLLLQYKWFFR